MADAVARNELVIIRVEGMHCHKCQLNIRKALQAHRGVHEVEVDLSAGLASVLFDPTAITVKKLMKAITDAGYQAAGFTRQQANPPG
jgi:copper chaperone CopZ